MSRFILIVLHYLRRAFNDVKEIVLLIAIPLGLVVFQIVIGSNIDIDFYFYGYNALASVIAPAFLLSFQFFNSMFMFGFLYSDFRSDMRWRLFAVPCSLRTYILPAFIANWLLNIILGIIYIIITALFMNVYWGNLLVLIVVLMLISLIATFSAVLIFQFTNKLSKANAMGYILAFGMMVLSGFMFPLQLLGDNVVIRFLLQYGTPLTLGTSAILSSGDLLTVFEGINVGLPGFGIGARDITVTFTNIGILAIIAVVVGAISLVAGKRRMT